MIAQCHRNAEAKQVSSNRFSVPLPVVVLALFQVAAAAQGSEGEIHIQPRIQSVNRAISVSTSLSASTALIREKVNLVLVPVTLTDAANRLVTGLNPTNFQLYESKRPQKVKYLSRVDAPISVGVILDVSGSMGTKIEKAGEAVVALLQASNPEDEFFLMTFADTPTLAHDFTQDINELQSALLLTRPKGRTCLLDAIYLAVQKMTKARYSRAALVIVSDGGDNQSRYTEKDVKSLVKEANVLVYSIGIFDREFATREELLGPQLLSDISTVTGASSFVLDSPNQLPGIMNRVARELRNQYLLGYQPGTLKHDGKWRHIKVKLSLPRGWPALRVQARTGYYAPTD